jgi:hypothetical protein
MNDLMIESVFSISKTWQKKFFNVEKLCVSFLFLEMIGSFNILVSVILIAVAIGETSTARNEGFRLAGYYQDNMVLQREPYNAIIWGYASSSDVTVTISLLGREYATRPATTGNSTVWRIKLDPIKADNQPVNITINQTTGSGLVNSLQQSIDRGVPEAT